MKDRIHTLKEEFITSFEQCFENIPHASFVTFAHDLERIGCFDEGRRVEFEERLFTHIRNSQEVPASEIDSAKRGLHALCQTDILSTIVDIRRIKYDIMLSDEEHCEDITRSILRVKDALCIYEEINEEDNKVEDCIKVRWSIVLEDLKQLVVYFYADRLRSWLDTLEERDRHYEAIRRKMFHFRDIHEEITSLVSEDEDFVLKYYDEIIGGLTELQAHLHKEKARIEIRNEMKA